MDKLGLVYMIHKTNDFVCFHLTQKGDPFNIISMLVN